MINTTQNCITKTKEMTPKQWPFSYFQKDKSVLGEWYRSKEIQRHVVKYCDMDADCTSKDPPGCDKLKPKILSNGRSSLVDKLRE